MKRTYTLAAEPARHNLAGAGLRAGKGPQRFTQVTAFPAREQSADIDPRELQEFLEQIDTRGPDSWLEGRHRSGLRPPSWNERPPDRMSEEPLEEP